MAVERDFAARVAAEAYRVAFDFFRPSPEWEMQELEAVDLSGADGKPCAQLWFRPNYLSAKIVYDPAHMDDGAHLWGSIGHECAHLLLCEFDAIQQSTTGHMDQILTHANERTVTRLERLFKRERVYPGDDAFKGGET